MIFYNAYLLNKSLNVVINSDGLISNTRVNEISYPHLVSLKLDKFLAYFFILRGAWYYFS
jgi:hypothetical protein